MNVCVLTNVGEGCGIAQYGADLIRELSKWYEVNKFGLDIEKYSVVVVNWHPSRLSIDADTIRQWQKWGCKVIILVHNSSEGMVLSGSNNILAIADAVVAHEPVEFRGAVKKFRHINIGIPEVGKLTDVVRPIAVGTAGFAFPHREFDFIVDIAVRLHISANMICPPYPCHVDPNFLETQWAAKLNGNLRMVKTFLPVKEVVQRLHESTVNVFWFESKIPNDDLGQSASVLMGIAAQRPVVLNTNKKHRTLFPYSDELYFCDTKEEAVSKVTEIIKTQTPKLPHKILQDRVWSKVALDWKFLIDEVAIN